VYRIADIDDGCGTDSIISAVSVKRDLAEFVACHRPHGGLTGDATEPTPNGYMVEVSCICGVVFMRWVTLDEAVQHLICDNVARLPGSG
jgi:hypothetical protein